MKRLGLLKADAKKKLKGKWIDAAAFEVLWLAMIFVAAQLTQFRHVPPLAMMIFFAVYIMILGPLHYVSALYFSKLVNGKRANLSVFREMPKHFARNLAVTVYQLIFEIILTFITGVIVLVASGLSLSGEVESIMMACYVIEGLWIAVSLLVGLYFSQVWLVLAESPNMDAWEAIKKSCLLMCNHEGYFMLMMLSFVGWGIVAVCTAGIGLIFVLPYLMVCKVLFYQEIRPNIFTNIKDVGEKMRKSVQKMAARARRK